MSSTWTKRFHLVVMIYYLCWGIYFLTTVLPNIFEASTHIWDNFISVLLKSLSAWGLIPHITYFTLATLEDILELKSRSSRTLSAFLNLIFTCYNVPFTLALSIIFWIVYSDDPANIDYYNIVGKSFPTILLHVAHTYPVLINLIEQCTQYRRYPRLMNTGYKHADAYLVLHYLIVAATLPFSPNWGYPIYEKLTPTLWICSLILGASLLNAMHFVGYHINHIIWGKSRKT